MSLSIPKTLSAFVDKVSFPKTSSAPRSKGPELGLESSDDFEVRLERPGHANEQLEMA